MNLRKLLLLTAIFLVAVPAAWARYPTITANSVCTEQGLMIQFTSRSWSPEPSIGENPQIDILFNGVKVFQGAYVYPGNSFSGSAPAPSGVAPGGSVTVSAVAVGTWVNGSAGGQSTYVKVTLPTEPCDTQEGTGRFTGGGHQIRVDYVRVTRGLTIHCDLLLSNNLEINWLGKSFHTTEHLVTTECSDSPEIIQAPPVAPLDTLRGVGTGRFNGEYGYTIEFTLVDAGEPGTADKAAFKIYKTDDPTQIVLDLPLQVLTGGNLQAHYDQPHK